MTETERQEVRYYYDEMTTEALLELHAGGTLTAEAYEALEAVLAGRSVPVPKRPREAGGTRERKLSTRWALRLAAFGAACPLVCLALQFKPAAARAVCELCWPSAIILFAADGRFNLAIYSVSIAVNALAWAGLGWIIGYGLSARKA